MHEARTFLQDLALVLCVAAVAAVLFRRLRQPVVLGYLLAGMIIGPHVPIPLFADVHRIHTLSELGVILVMFSIGLEFSIGRLARVLPTAGLTGLVQITGMLWLGYTAGRLFGWTWQESLVAGAMLCISSTMIVARVFAEQRVERRLADIVFGVLIVEDLAAVLLITILTTLTTGAGLEASELAATAGRLAGFLLGTIVLGFVVVPRAIRMVSRLGSTETLLVASMGICFGLALLAQQLGYSVALGAFVAGSLVAESGQSKKVEHQITPLRDLFAAVFFVSVGMSVDPAVILDQWLVVLVLTALVIFGQTWFVSLGTFLSGQDVRTSIRAGMSLAQIGEFSFIIAGVGVASGAVGSFIESVAVAVAVITTFTTPWLVRISEPTALRIESRLPHPLQTFASLYGSWLETMRARRARPQAGSPVRRLVVLLVVDASIIMAIVVGVSVAWPTLTRILVHDLAVPAAAATALVLIGAVLAIAPFALGVLRCARNLGASLASLALPVVASERLDLAAAPRRALVLTLQLAILMLVGIPLIALTQPFLPLFYGALLLVVVVALMGVSFWRSTTNLQGHIQAGAEVVIELLRRQRGSADESLEERLDALLPGLGPVTPVRLTGEHAAVGHTLAQLELRGRSGANVIAIMREQGSDDHGDGHGSVVTPTGHEALAEGDVLALSGTREAIATAIALLRQERQERQERDAAGAG